MALRGTTFSPTQTVAIARASVRRRRASRFGREPLATQRSDGSISCTWQLGDRGLVRTRFEVVGQTFDGGAGNPTAMPGSPVYRILGGAEHREGIGVVRSFSLRGIVELTGSP